MLCNDGTNTIKRNDCGSSKVEPLTVNVMALKYFQNHFISEK